MLVSQTRLKPTSANSWKLFKNLNYNLPSSQNEQIFFKMETAFWSKTFRCANLFCVFRNTNMRCCCHPTWRMFSSSLKKKSMTFKAQKCTEFNMLKCHVVLSNTFLLLHQLYSPKDAVMDDCSFSKLYSSMGIPF